jgi:hypothetical protein
MCFFISFMPATFLVVIGYFVLFSSLWAGNGVQTFGRILAIWIFVIAAFIPIAGAYVTLAGLCPSLKTLHSTMMPAPVQQ